MSDLQLLSKALLQPPPLQKDPYTAAVATSKGLLRTSAQRNLSHRVRRSSIMEIPNDTCLFDPGVAVLSTDPQGFERPGLGLGQLEGGFSCTAEAVEQLLKHSAAPEVGRGRGTGAEGEAG